MKMNKLFAGLIAFVAGVALSAGSAFATKGYTIGDPAGMKLVPFYMAGETVFTAIAVQNMSAQEQSTEDAHKLVTDIQAFIDDKSLKATDSVANAIGALVKNGDLHDDDRDIIAAAETALETAMTATYVEHLLVNVQVYDAMGMAMLDMPVELCLGEHQAGYVLLTGPDVPEQMIENRGAVVSMAMDDIDDSGYVTVTAGTKYEDCVGSRQGGLVAVETGERGPANNDGTYTYKDVDTVGDSTVAAWTILQDVGTGFFGTEIPTSTMTMTTGDDPEIACYDTEDVFNGTKEGDQYKCGLIPERHNNSSDYLPSMVTVRFDVIEGTENDVYVWLAEGEDGEDTKKVDRRKLEVTTYCEDGMMARIPDTSPNAEDGDMVSMAMVPAPDMVTMIDPMDDMLAPYTSQCMESGGRGILQFDMPDGSYAGMAWTHISQRMANFRMNFPGYNMADPDKQNQ